MPTEVIVIGDSTNNTLSAIRSFGRAGVRQTLILVCQHDTCNVRHSRYLTTADTHVVPNVEEALPILATLQTPGAKPFLICTFDAAAVLVDNHEPQLAQHFVTPCRGRQLGDLFNKDAQCRLAEQCGILVPKSINFSRNDTIESITIPYPLIIKPINSTKGEKEDIHICHTPGELRQSLNEQSHCENFILQEFVEKEYELDCIGVMTDQGMILPGAVLKHRHWPPLIGAGAYGLFTPVDDQNINFQGLETFLKQSGYHGPFSVEFLHKGDKNYFMEVNFRNEGLAYAATVAGANLHARYVDPSVKIDKVKPTYMMNYSLDFLYVKNGDLPLRTWLRDFLRTRCFINFSLRDPKPLAAHYYHKLFRRK